MPTGSDGGAAVPPCTAAPMVRAEDHGAARLLVLDRPDRLDAMGMALDAELAALPAPALRATKALFYRALDTDFAAGLHAAHQSHRAMRAFPKHSSTERFSK